MAKGVTAAILGAVGAGLFGASAIGGDAYQHEFRAIDGTPMPLAAFRGKVMLVVNTASFCGFTPQYKGLQALHEKYESEGLVIIGVPSNDFGGQEPKAEAEVKTFCEGAYGVTFPLTSKYVVSGQGAHPFYVWAASSHGAPWWNFHKYLVGRDGRIAAAFGTATRPDNAAFIRSIETELAKSALDGGASNRQAGISPGE